MAHLVSSERIVGLVVSLGSGIPLSNPQSNASTCLTQSGQTYYYISLSILFLVDQLTTSETEVRHRTFNFHPSFVCVFVFPGSILSSRLLVQPLGR